ncbi:hypothetical protein PF005_g6277 [Phytophthora fragariae]|uniref:Uncharacterized protein n=1 Tax=Phytophthora fragariae TaxID=53985 RepID=A0A6A3FRF2_9STRA|nr:hypothetical protein PF009_g3350 [Phytophthora fragariae]KAE9004122.1 hypothetical protein PF011_g12599 [Phytophthora fragariae]KAE9123374.1 hypothetical protein PF007_g7078 [Phytophthora fragariae]KAE9151992.1 hypothetical protein PF006_g3744 [Phytophthora fragariae]KAE9223505.1 hypothetical protein PF005_g6277 [Phytophthora fragariae]
MRGEGQRLSTHLKAAFVEIDRLTDVYRNAINKLETYALPNLSPQSAAKWFELYLRVVDLGVQIRRGEIRHRTAQSFTYPCMHKTGTRGAVHSGLSIDDCNSILLLMTDRDLVKEGRVSRWCNRIDGVDRDNVGELDKKLSSCLRTFIDRRSKFYDRLEVNGGDPHQKLLVLGGPGAAAPILLKVTRTCFGPKKCSCGEDAKPWENFCLEAGGPDTQSHLATRVTESAQTDDMGIMDIKRQMGFQELSREEENNDAAALAREAAELVRRRHPRGQSNAAASALRVPPSAKSIYQKKCEEIGPNSKPHISAVLTVKNGAHLLDHSSIGFHSADDLQDLVDIFSSSGLPPVKVLDVSNGFFNAPAFKVLCQLLRLPQPCGWIPVPSWWLKGAGSLVQYSPV